LKHISRGQRFLVLAIPLLAGLVLLTLPVSYALWREVLGVRAGVDTGQSKVTMTSATLQTPILSSTPGTPTNPGQPTATTIPVTEVPTELAPTESLTTEPSLTNLPATEEPTATSGSLVTEPATEPLTEPSPSE
jgi:hypothetical protein